MKKSLLLFLPLLICAGEWMPSTSDLNASRARAEAAWGLDHIEATSLAFAPLGPCARQGTLDRYAETDMITSEVRLNINCRWDAQLLDLVIAHEFGHIALQSVAHSLNPKSAMYWQIKRGQKVQPEDLDRLHDASERERPTLMSAK